MKRLLSLLTALLLVTCSAMAETALPDTLTLLAINVRKADCLLLTSGTSAYLIDTGTEESYGAVSAALKLHGVTHLNGVIVTHTDGDHTGGAMALASSSIQVDAWYAPKFFTGVKAKKHPLVKAAALRGEDVTWLSAGDTLPLDGGTLTVIGPVQINQDKDNNNSLVLRAETADGAMLLTGDMEFAEEYTLFQQNLIQPADVLKVPDHAEEHATSEALVNAVHPAVAVISTNAADEPDTPSPRVLQALKQVDAQVAVTQDAQLGVQVTLRKGTPETSLLSYGTLPTAATDVAFSDKSVAQDAVCIRNNGGDAVDLSGWFIYSDRGGEIFVFPEGTSIAPNQSYSVTTLSSESGGDFVWQDKNVWHETKTDTSILCDVYGREISRME